MAAKLEGSEPPVSTLPVQSAPKGIGDNQSERFEFPFPPVRVRACGERGRAGRFPTPTPTRGAAPPPFQCVRGALAD
ncbi:hypothetical protein MRX96_013993 [Rhipicephalus microplus]